MEFQIHFIRHLSSLNNTVQPVTNIQIHLRWGRVPLVSRLFFKQDAVGVNIRFIERIEDPLLCYYDTRILEIKV